MITITLHEAKAKLNRLVDQACAGEQVVLMRGSKIVATIQPLSSEDLEIAPQLTDIQAKRFWAEVNEESSKIFSNPKAAMTYLKKKTSSI